MLSIETFNLHVRKAAHAAAENPPETIFLVEDDPDVRAFTVEMVRELGYDVLELAPRIRSVRDGQDSPRHAN